MARCRCIFIVNNFDSSADDSELIVDKVEDTSSLALIERAPASR
jgi:hypothetical protein